MPITTVDAAGDRLTLHYRTEVFIRGELAATIQRFAQQQPASFAAFQTHYTNAQIVSQGEVRTIDILTWMSKDIPPAVNTAIIELQTYLHEEAFLRHDLAVLKFRELTTNDWTADHKGGNATLILRHQDQGKHLLQYLRAGLDARVVRVNDASISSRYGAQNWHDSVEGKTYKWITAVVRYLSEQLDAVKLLARQFSRNVVPAGENATQLSLDEAKQALKLTTFTEDGEQFDSLIFAMKERRDEMEHRQSLLKGLIKCRAILESIEDEIKKAEDASDEDRLAALAARKKLKDDKAGIYIAKIEINLGPRAGWDWVPA
ncbi:hypothetical protein LTR35_014720 [Friedmanniomyces endolithicus]|nr:hypothetical protein LTR35_014720 [Friedmanniomyces endolithicus]KAK0271866.1 hypothetical protein LTS00_016480 [Friedmanniomyces endolithicus]